MWKYIVVALIYTYQSLPQCDFGNGITCSAAHGTYIQDTVRVEFNNREEMRLWISQRETPKTGSAYIFGIINTFKIDSVFIKTKKPPR